MDSEELRRQSQREIEGVVNTNANVTRIIHHTKEDTETQTGLSWTNLSRVFFNKNESVGTLSEIKEKLEQYGYLAVIEEEDGEPCITVETTAEVDERLD